MKRCYKDEFKVGVFVVLGFLMAMLMLFMISSDRQFFKSYYTLHATFEDISGLRTGAPVQLAGVSVGYVDGISFSKDSSVKKISVILQIKGDYQERIRNDSVATVETQGLLGDKFIYVSVGNHKEAALTDGDDILSKETTSIFALAEKAGDIMENVSHASEAIGDMVGAFKGKKGESHVTAILKSLRHSVEEVEKGDGLVHALLYDSKGKDVVANLSSTLDSIHDVLVTAKEESGDDLGGLISNLRQASYDMKEITSAVKRGEGTLGQFVTDSSVHDELKTLLGHVNRNKLLRAMIRSTLKKRDPIEK